MTEWKWSGLLAAVALLVQLVAGSTPAQSAGDVSKERISATIQAAHFAEPLVPTSPTTSAEDQALLQALTAYSHRAVPEDFSSLNAFLSIYPRSGWAPALLTNLGLSYLHDGYFSRALGAWERAWKDGEDAGDPPAKALVDRAVGELARLEASLGNNKRLAALFDEIGKRPITGSATELIQTAREELSLSVKGPRHLFICGPLALEALMTAQGAKFEQVEFLRWYHAGPKGTSLAEVGRLAGRAHFSYRLIFRKPGQPVPVPAVVHLKIGHFATIVGEANGRFHIQDSVMATRDIWMTQAALDSEASGYFLVPIGAQAGAGWREVKTAEAATIRGKGSTNGTEPGAAGTRDPKANPPPPPCTNCPCSGMCGYNIGESTVSVSLSDTPVGYRPPIGPSAKTTITYNQREDSQPANFSFFNISAKWTLNWLSYVTDDPNNAGANVSRYLAGGGAYYYTGYKASTGQFVAQDNDGSILVRASQAPITYRHQLADGSVEIYGQSDGAASYPRNIFLSQIIDSQGNTLTLNYDGQQRLTSLTDATGRQTTFTYGLPGHSLMVTQITDPFGRSANLTYDASARLSSITDVIGLTSSFTYDANSLVDSMTTPYGTTNFAYTAPGASGPPRFVQVTDPLGYHEREEWLEPAPIPDSDPAATVPTGMPSAPQNQYLSYRDSFHWDKNAYILAGCTPTGGCDYSKARDRHFAHDTNNFSLKSTSIESVKYPLENRIWFNYPGQASALESGAYTKPIATARVLDDGTTQLSQSSYDTTGYFKLTQTADPVGRITSFAYGNHIDLAAISQTTAYGLQTTIAQFIYNTQHRPIFYTDAAGQTTSYAYNAAGQLTSVTNPLGQTTSYQYNASGDLTSIINANSVTAASFTYDAYDRVRTYTDSEGWTATYDYDAADRVTKITYPDGTTDLYTYDKLDLAAYQDRLGRVWTYVHDVNRRLTQITDPLGNQTVLGYNGIDELTSLTDPKNNTTNWNYDVEGRLTLKTYADSSTGTYTYENTTSRLKSALDALGQTKQYAYAQDDRLVGITYLNAVNPTPNVGFSYDAYFPRLASMTDRNGATRYDYVPVGSLGALRLQQEQSPLSSSAIAYAYDELGRLTSRAVAGAGAETFGFDAIGRLISHTSDLGSFTLSYLGQTGQISQRQLASSTLATTWGYLPNSGDRRLASIDSTGLSAGQYSNYTYTTTPENFITAIGEISDASSVYPGSLTQSGAYNNLNQLTNLSGQTLTYDADGNLLSDGQRNYTWDAESRLVGISYPGQSGKLTAFSYDGLGRRTIIASTPVGGGSAVTTSYIWCGVRLCQARDASNSPTRGYYAEGEFVPGSPAQPYYYGPDQIGSVRRAFASASSAPAYSYDPYGNALQATAPVTDFGYAGMFTNADSGLYLTQYRVYDPIAGRWLSRDPVGQAMDKPDSTIPRPVRAKGEVNLYMYVGSDPIGSIDSRGLWQVTVGGGWGFGAAVTFGVNGGQYNFGTYFGFGQGLSLDIDPRDVGQHPCGLDAGVMGSLDLGTLGISSTINLQGDNSAAVNVPLPNAPWVSTNVLDPGNPTISIGVGGYVGGGGTYYFR
jgi:RHS repeat-associated protein